MVFVLKMLFKKTQPPMASRPVNTGVGSGGYAGDLTPQLFMWGY